MSKILITGAAGFIGMHAAKKLLEEGEDVVGIDSLNDYYDVNLKHNRLKILEAYPNFKFKKINIANRGELNKLFNSHDIEFVAHFAAQAGVRYSILNPHVYGESNLIGFLNTIEAARNAHIKHFVYASSSSVYGLNETTPFSENITTDHPISLYASTKKANELIAHSYSHLFGLPTTGLRFFTAYGPWGRPDMSPAIFAKAIFEGRPINVFNNGDMYRDFTYIDDISKVVSKILRKPATRSAEFNPLNPTPNISSSPWKIFNVGNSCSVKLIEYIEIMADIIGKNAIKNYLPLQAGDLITTSADVSNLSEWIDFTPSTNIKSGLASFVSWYRSYYSL